VSHPLAGTLVAAARLPRASGSTLTTCAPSRTSICPP